MKSSLLPALILLGALLSSAAAAPNVVIFAPDGLRADRLGVYGYARRATSPAIDAAAKTGLVFDNAEAQASWTLPSFASLFTSLYPQRHGALWSNGKISAKDPTLAELFAARGYRTAAFVGGPFLSPEYGFARGFDTYNANGQRYFPETLPPALDWIKAGRGDKRPFFLFVHGNDVHPPFNPALPEAVRDRFDAGYKGPANDLLLDYYFVRVFNRYEWQEWGPAPDEAYKSKVAAIRADPRSVEHIGALYDSQVARVDESFAQLMTFLRSEGLERDTIVVLLSDHGLELGERGLLGTGYHAVSYETITHVPLIFWGPGLKASRRADVAQIIDVAPTLLSLAGQPAPASFAGRSLAAPAAERAALGASTVLGSPEIREYYLRDKAWKLIYRMTGRRHELYDLSSDPGEKTDLAGAQAQRARALADELTGLTAAPR